MSQKVINFVHANGFPAGSYSTFFDYLTPEYSVIANPQYGHNSLYSFKNNWQGLVNELVDFVKQQDEKVYCVGHSFGGVVSFMAACQHPELFRGLIMLDPPLITGPLAWFLKAAKPTRLIDKITPAGKSKIRRQHWPLNSDMVAQFEHRKLFKHFDPRCLQDYAKHGVKEKNGQLTLAFSPKVETGIFRNMPSNLSSYNNKLKIPAALIYAQHTDVGSPHFFKRFAKKHKMLLQTMPNVGHMFPLEQPEQTSLLINDILNRW